MRPDLVVVGAGIVGAAIAREAADAGLRVTVVSADLPGAAVTATGMGHIVVLDDNPAELALCRFSSALWEKWRDDPAAEFHHCGTLWVATNDYEAALLMQKALRLTAAGVSSTFIDTKDIARFEPHLAPGLAGALRITQDAVVYAPRVAARLLADVKGQHAPNAITFLSDQVTSIDASGLRLAKNGVLSAGVIVIAAGLGSPSLLPQLTLIPRKGHLVITDRYPGLVNHQVLEVGYSASAHGAGESVAFNIQPRPTGQLLIGSSRQPGVETRAIDPAIVGRMMTRAIRFLPHIARLSAIRIWAGIRPGTADGLPYIGPWPLIPQCWLATGHEGIGITTALGSARLLLDQILGRESAIDPTPYLPARLFAAGTHT